MESKRKLSTLSTNEGKTDDDCNRRTLTVQKPSRLNRFLDELYTTNVDVQHQHRSVFLKTIQNYQRLPKISTNNGIAMNQGISTKTKSTSKRDHHLLPNPKQIQSSLDHRMTPTNVQHHDDEQSSSRQILPPLKRHRDVIESVLKNSIHRRIRRLTADIGGSIKLDQPEIANHCDDKSKLSMTNTSCEERTNKKATIMDNHVTANITHSGKTTDKKTTTIMDSVVINRLTEKVRLKGSSSSSSIPNERKSAKNFLNTIKAYKEQRRKVG